MAVCFYCEKNETVTSKFSKPICENCNNQDIRPSENEGDEIKASRLKMLISIFEKIGN